MSLDSLNNMLRDALALRKLPPAFFNASGMAEVNADGLKLGLEYVEKEDMLQIYCSVSTLPDDAASFCEMLLQKNLFGAGLGGGHLGLHASTRSLIFSAGLPLALLDAQKMANALDRFSEKAVELINELEEYRCRLPQSADHSAFMGNMLWV